MNKTSTTKSATKMNSKKTYRLWPRNIIDGVWEHSYERTKRHWHRLQRAMSAASAYFAISYHTGNLCCVWPGNHWPVDGVPRRLGELPREKLITELRAIRSVLKASYDPLTIKPARGHRRVRFNRMQDGVMIPPPLIRRSFPPNGAGPFLP